MFIKGTEPEKGRCRFATDGTCLVPSVSCFYEAHLSCSEGSRFEKARVTSCPAYKGGKCDIPQYRGHVINPNICEGAEECPLAKVRHAIPVRDFREDVVYPSTFPPQSSAKEIVIRLREANL